MTDYKNHFEQFVADLYKKIDEEDKKRESKNIVGKNYEKIEKKLSVLIEKFEKRLVQEPIQILDNSQFIQLMGISQKLSQTWRDTGVVSFSQVGNKIYYRVSDIQELLNKTYHKSTIR
jgi:hypothetical protein